MSIMLYRICTLWRTPSHNLFYKLKRDQSTMAPQLAQIISPANQQTVNCLQMHVWCSNATDFQKPYFKDAVKLILEEVNWWKYMLQISNLCVNDASKCPIQWAYVAGRHWFRQCSKLDVHDICWISTVPMMNHPFPTWVSIEKRTWANRNRYSSAVIVSSSKKLVWHA